MATNYPGAVDSFVNPTASDTLDSVTVPHAAQHDNANDAIHAVQVTLGVNPQGSAATVVARLDALDSTVSGKVSTVTAGDSTITVAGTSTNPTVAVNSIPSSKISDKSTTLVTSVSGGGFTKHGDVIINGNNGIDVVSSPYDNAITVRNAGVVSVTAGDSTITIGGVNNNNPTVAVNTIPSSKISDKGSANGVASLDGSGLVPANQLPALVINQTYVVASQSAMLALSANVGDMAIRTDINESFILQATPASTLANWIQILAPTAGVSSITASSPLTGGTITSTGSIGIQSASTTQSGAVQLTDSTSSTSTTTAATPNSVKSAYDLANGKAATNQTMYIGTTGVAINRASGSLALTGTSIDGNAGTATTLQTARTINGTSFDGSANITISIDGGSA